MKRQIKLTALLLTLVLLLTTLPAPASAVQQEQSVEPLSEETPIPVIADYDFPTSGTFGDNMTWVLDDYGTLTISGEGDMPDFKEHRAPWNEVREQIINVKIQPGITSIGYFAFLRCSNMTRIRIPDTVTRIAHRAFYECRSLVTVTIPDSVIYMGEYAFAYCESLTSVRLSNRLPLINYYSFLYCTALTSITIPESVTTIEEGAFQYCTALEDVMIPDNGIEIWSDVFQGCDSLTEITFPDSASLGGVLKDCANLRSVKLPASEKHIGFRMFENCASLTDVTIPDGVTDISYHAFQNCDSLTDIAIPDSVKSIEGDAFYDCDKLTSITIPAGVTKIGSYQSPPFSACDNLKEIRVDPNNPNYSSVNGILYNKDHTELIQVPGAYEGAVTIPEGQTRIYSGSFASCRSVTSVTIPASVTEIDAGAFTNCNSLTKFIVASDNPNYSSNAQGALLSKDQTKLVVGTQGTAGHFVIPDGITTIGAYAFQGNENLVRVTIPDSVTEIHGYAFRDCTNLTDVDFGSSLTMIDDSAFENCVKLENVVLPDCVAEIGSRAFKSCESLTSFKLPEDLPWSSIPSNIFDGCSNLTQIVDNDSSYYGTDGQNVYNWPYDTLVFVLDTVEGTHSLTASFRRIADNAFYGCDRLTKLIITGGKWGDAEWEADGAFYHLPQLKTAGPMGGGYDIEWNSKASTIGEGAFSSSWITSILIPENIDRIEENAFYGANNLRKMVIMNPDCEIDADMYASAYEKVVIYGWEGSTAQAYAEANSLIFVSLEGLVTYPDPEEEPEEPEEDPISTRVQPYTFKFAGVLSGKDVSATCYYTDAYFLEDASAFDSYDNHLATMSLCFELTTWSRHTGKWKSPGVHISDKNTRWHNAYDLLTRLGYTDFALNEFWADKPTKDSIGVVAATKKNEFDGSTMIAVGVRGGGYGQEWASNFTVGDSGSHDGFAEARDNVLEFLRDYIKRKHLSGDIKIWMVGYSRAGAVANMTGGALLDGYSLDYTDWDGKTVKVNVAPEDLFVYTFEAPQGVQDSAVPMGGYFSIHNVVNPNDLVPMVAPEAWGFTRYNKFKDHYLPSAATSSRFDESFYRMKQNMLDFYGDFKGDTSYHISESTTDWELKLDLKKILPGGDPVLELVEHEIPTNTALKKGVDVLAQHILGSRKTYASDFQSGVREILALIYGGSVTDTVTGDIANFSLEQFMDRFTREMTPKRLLAVFKPAYAFTLDTPDERMDKVRKNFTELVGEILEDSDIWGTISFAANFKTSFADLLWRLLDACAEDLISKDVNTLESIMNFIQVLKDCGMQAHYPELTLAWLMSMDEYYEGGDIDTAVNTNYRTVRINCPVDVQVYQSDTDTMVAAIIDDVPRQIAGSSILAMCSADREKVVILPSDAEYTVSITATGDGEMNCCVEEFDLTTGTTARIQEHTAIHIQEGDVLTASIPALEEQERQSALPNGSGAEYILMGPDDKELTPDMELTGEAAAVSYEVSVSCDSEFGSVSGGGTYTTGSFARVTAAPVNGSEFAGWYLDGSLVCREQEYRFRVSADATLEARFTGVPMYVLTLEAGPNGSVINTPVRITAGSRIQLEAAPDKGFGLERWCADAGEFENSAKAKTWFTMPTCDVQVRAEFAELVNPFTDVPTDSFYYYPVLWAVEQGITTGTTGTTFDPGGYCQRAQVVTFLWRAAGCPESVSCINPFADVKESDFYYKAVLWAVEQGITTGLDASHFGPYTYCNRAQVVTFLYRAMGQPNVSVTKCPFTDVQKGAWYQLPVLWAVENGVTNGMSATTFGVENICNRAQVVTFLYRAFSE